MPEMHFLQDLLVLFGLGVFVVVAFHRLNLPPVLGFLITGVICGPFGFKLVDDAHSIETLAEMGLVLLLFTTGIEFSIGTFLKMRRFLLIAGGLQLLGTIAMTAALANFAGINWTTAAFLGMLVSLSSTAIVVRILEYRGEFDTAQGRSALSILIFQDLCIVPMVLIVPFLGGQGAGLTEMGLVIGKALLFVVVAFTVARFVVPWLLNQVAMTQKREAFVLSIILLCLGTATATSQVGLSMALGAFVAGLVLSESKYSHQALGEILPFREVFNCLVFVSIGMLFDVRVLLSNPTTVLLCLAIVVLGKALVAGSVTKLMGHSLKVSLLTGLALSQISEFSFVLAKLGLNVGLIDSQTNQLFLAAAILSMFFTPAFLDVGKKVAYFLEKVLPPFITSGRNSQVDDAVEKMRDHVIIVGFGHSGRTLAEWLERAAISYVVVDLDPAVVRGEREKGRAIFYGDASRQEILEHAGIERARVLALTLTDRTAVERSAELARRLKPELKTIARVRFVDDVDRLLRVGAEEVVSEEAVASVEILRRVLKQYEVEETVKEEIASRAAKDVNDSQADVVKAAPRSPDGADSGAGGTVESKIAAKEKEDWHE